MIIPSKKVCDLCGADCNMTIKLPMLTDCNWTDGYPEAEHIELEQIDICETCLKKVTKIRCDFQGNNKRIIHD